MIFIEEIDRALYNILKTIKIEGKKIDVTHKFPDKDLWSTEYPTISFTDYNVALADTQYNRQKILVSQNKNNYKGLKKEHRIYYNISYQIDYWSLYKTDIIKMMTQHLNKIKPLGYIPVIDSFGTETETPCFLDAKFKNLDEYKENKRLFRRSFSLKVIGYLDGDEEEVNLIRERKIKVVKP